jgi:hypothetical protein
MTQSQHDGILFFLATLFACAVAGAALTVCGCGGAEFTVLETTIPDAAPRLVDRDVVERAPEIRAAEASMSETAPLNVDAMNTRDAETVESSIDTKDVEAARPDAATCDLAACPTHCPGGNPACCTTEGACGCSDFGPVCLSI